MTSSRGVCTIALALVAIPALARVQTPAPAPQIQNGRVETRPGTAIDREIAAVSPAGSSDPVWVGWRVPMIAGDRDHCTIWYTERAGWTRGMVVEDGTVFVSGDALGAGARPEFPKPTGAIPLEGGTRLVVLARLIGGRIERLRMTGDDCPLDAGGRTVYWLSAIQPGESLRFLSSLTQPPPDGRALTEQERTIATSAVRTVGYHEGADADAVLTRIATSNPDLTTRRQAASTMGSLRGAAGVSALVRLIEAEKEPAQRRALVTALGQSREASAIAPLRGLARDPDAGVRGEAAALFVLRGGPASVQDALSMLTAESDDAVRKRIVAAIGRLPLDAGVPHLLQLARSSPHQSVRTEAVRALSQSKDPRALAYLEEILKRTPNP